jgi:glycosyltransferase involved in cell wall biosynthesis
VIGGLQDCGVEVTTAMPRSLDLSMRPPTEELVCTFEPPRNLHPELAEADLDRAVAAQLARRGAPGIDLVYQRYSLFALAGLAVAHRYSIPLVLEVNASEVRFRKQWDSITFARMGARFESRIFAAASLVVAVSERVASDVLDIAPSANVVVIPNGVDVHAFEVAASDRDSVRMSLRAAGDDVVIGFFGRFYPWHGTETLTTAALRFLPLDRRLRLLLVGEGAGRDSAEQALLPWADRVHFTGIVPHAQVPALMNACDILVSPHAPSPGFIGSPMKVFEYMASGRAIIASRLEQIATVLEHGRTAILIKPGDASDLVGAVVTLAGDSSLRERLGAQAQQDALNNHSWQQKMLRVLGAVSGSADS